MNTQFDKALSGYVAAENKGATAFGSLLQYAYDVVKEQTGDSKAVANVLGNGIKGEELAFRSVHPKLKEFPVSYRTAKSVIMSAVKAGVALVDAAGKLRSKSELEALVKVGKEKKSAVQRFETLITNAGNVFAEVDTLEDVRQCKALVAILSDMVCKAEASLIGASHREKADLSDEDKAFMAAELQARALAAGMSAAAH